LPGVIHDTIFVFPRSVRETATGQPDSALLIHSSVEAVIHDLSTIHPSEDEPLQLSDQA
jgi:hypothetical protein